MGKITIMKEWMSNRRNQTILFVTFSIFFAFVLSFAQIIGDDIGGMRVLDGNLKAYWEYALYVYEVWSSRTLVDFVIFIFTDSPIIVWAIAMGIAFFAFLKTFTVLCGAEGEDSVGLLALCLLLLFPYKDLGSGGWMSVTGTYYIPVAFGFAALIPIRKKVLKERMKWWECIIYALFLTYAANNEQMLIILLACYGLSTIYFLCNKRFPVYNILMLAILGASTVYMMKCPGNASRTLREMKGRFPLFESLTMVDKADMGISTTMHWLFFGNQVFFVFCTIILTVLVFERYAKSNMKWIALGPAAFAVLFGPLQELTLKLFPYMEWLVKDIPEMGLVTPSNRGNMAVFGSYFVVGIILCMFLLVIILLQNNVEQLLTVLCILGAGIACRAAMGFTPNIYASRERTFAIMNFCIIAVTIFSFAWNKKAGYISEKTLKYIKVINWCLIILSAIQLWFFVYEADNLTILY